MAQVNNAPFLSILLDLTAPFDSLDQPLCKTNFSGALILADIKCALPGSITRNIRTRPLRKKNEMWKETYAEGQNASLYH